MTRTARIFCLVAAPAIVAAVASTAYGHARLMTPTPRDNRDGYKDMTPPGTGAPCGIVRAASQPSSNLTPGATLNVAWEETIDHPGCFVIDFSAGNDQNFQVIGRKSHANPPAKTGNPATRKYTMSVTLPSEPCTACTLRLRQMMLSADVPEANLATACPPTTIPANVTYYSCANVVLGGGGASGTGGAGGATGSAGRGGNAGGGRGGSAAGGAGGAGGSSGAGQAGTSGQAGDNGQAGATGQGGSGTTGQAGTTGQGGSATTGQAGSSGQAGSGTTGQAGTTGQSGTNGQGGATGQAGNGSSGAAGTTGTGGTGGTGGDDGGGCQTGGGATTAPLGLLFAAILISRGRRRSRS